MTNETWVALLMVAAALLPAVLVGLVFLGDRILAHPRYRALRWKLYEFQRSHPGAFTCATAVLALPAVAPFVANSDWHMIVPIALHLVGIYYLSPRAEPPFSEGPDDGRLT